MKKEKVLIIVSKSNQVKEVYECESEDDAKDFLLEKYKQIIKIIEPFDHHNTYISKDFTNAKISAGIYSIKLMLYKGCIQKFSSNWRDKK